MAWKDQVNATWGGSVVPTRSGKVAIFATFLVAFILVVLPGPAWLEQFRPDWIALVLIYWCLAWPERIGVGTAWCLGLALDVLYGSLLGQHAFALSVIAFVTVKSHLRLRIFPRWQQAVTVLLLLTVNQIILLWLKNLAGESFSGFGYWTSVIVGAALWPAVFSILRGIRRKVTVV